MQRHHNMINGALVADAAALGLHWLYDQDRVRALAINGPEFCATTAQDYQGVPSYFARPLKSTGDQSQYGEQLLVLLRAIAEQDGAYDKATYERHFTEHFGYGGTYTGYIDHATRETLNNLAKAQDKDEGHHGSDDVQLPALAKLPALVAAGHEAHAASAIRVTNNSDVAETYGLVATAMLCAARGGGDAKVCVQAGVNAADRSIRPGLDDACGATDRTTEYLTLSIGMACDLAFGLPSIMHNILTSNSYEQAVRKNILAGGDSCGRAIVLGGVMGAIHGVPEEWAQQLSCRSTVAELIP